MTFADWVQETKWRFRNRPTHEAAVCAAQEFYTGALRHGYRTTKSVFPARETPVWERDDWEVLCILDACRVDVMREVAASDDYSWLDADTVESITSVGSASPEWISNTFQPDYRSEFRTAGYLTGNPFSGKTMPRYPNLPVEDTAVGYLDEAWRTDWVQEDSNLGISTIPPEALTDRAINVWRNRRQHGINRLVIHYMQPHAPFRSEPGWFGDRRDLEGFGEMEIDEYGRDIWWRCRTGHVDRGELWAAYKDNLRWVLDDIERLKQNCEATIALSSDHGNGLGEWGVWSHPPETPVPAVRNVPWTTVDAVDKETASPSVESAATDSGLDVKDRLAALGYTEGSA